MLTPFFFFFDTGGSLYFAVEVGTPLLHQNTSQTPQHSSSNTFQRITVRTHIELRLDHV